MEDVVRIADIPGRFAAQRKHAVSTAATLFFRLDWGRRFSCGSFVCDDLLEAFDAVVSEGRDAVLTDAIDAQATILWEHVDRKFVQPILIFAEQFGNVADGEDVGDRSQGQAA
jgi:hypothetical protein